MRSHTFENIKEVAERGRLAPHSSSWDRIALKLDISKNRNKIRWRSIGFTLSTIAAAFLFMLVVRTNNDYSQQISFSRANYNNYQVVELNEGDVASIHEKSVHKLNKIYLKNEILERQEISPLRSSLD